MNDIFENIRDIISILIIRVPVASPIIKIPIQLINKGYAFTDGNTIYINPENWVKFSSRQKMGVLFHETLHILLMHVERQEDRDFKLWNDAADRVTNYFITEYHKDIELPPGATLDPTVGNLSVEEVYDLLKSGKMKGKGDLKDGRGKSVGKDPMDNDLLPEDEGVDYKELMSDIKISLDAAAKIAGELPAYFARELKQAFKVKNDWKRILSTLVREVVRFGGNRSYSCPKSWAWQYGIVLPGEVKKKKPVVCVIVDTSGSVDEKMLDKFISHLGQILLDVEYIRLITCDAKVHENIKIRNIHEILKQKKVKFLGRGGTDFVPALLEAQKTRADMVIYLTDGEGNYSPQVNIKNLLWAITKDKVTPPYGKFIHVD